MEHSTGLKGGIVCESYEPPVASIMLELSRLCNFDLFLSAELIYLSVW